MKVSRSAALQLARFERAALRARAKASSRCGEHWARAAQQADTTLQLIEARKDAKAMKAATAIGPYWKKAAECEGVFVRGLGAETEEVEVFSVEGALRQQQELLASIKATTERDLFFRKIATGAAIAGALFAAVRLTDIWLAVKRRRREEAR